jgi:hypothetical protein
MKRKKNVNNELKGNIDSNADINHPSHGSILVRTVSDEGITPPILLSLDVLLPSNTPSLPAVKSSFLKYISTLLVSSVTSSPNISPSLQLSTPSSLSLLLSTYANNAYDCKVSKYSLCVLGILMRNREVRRDVLAWRATLENSMIGVGKIERKNRREEENEKKEANKDVTFIQVLLSHMIIFSLALKSKAEIARHFNLLNMRLLY